MPRQALDLDQARDVGGLVLRRGMPDHQEPLRPPQGPLTPRCSRSEQSDERIQQEGGIELRPSGSADAVVRLVAVLVLQARDLPHSVEE